MDSPPSCRRAKEAALANLEQSLVDASRSGDADAAADILGQGANVNAENYNRTLFYASQVGERNYASQVGGKREFVFDFERCEILANHHVYLVY